MKTYLLTFGLVISLTSLAAAETAEKAFSVSSRQKTLFISLLPMLQIPEASHQMLINNIHSHIRGEGVRFPIRNYRNEYIKAGVYGMSGRQRIAETIGNSGVRHYAKVVGYQPLYEGSVGQGQGFDFVYRSGRRIVVIEAKGGSSMPKVYRGSLQGTPEYALSVAKATLRSKTADLAAKEAAKAVVRAYKTGRLDIEVTRTAHVYGKPTATTVKTVYGKTPNISEMSALHNISLRTGGIAALLGGGFDLLSQAHSGERIQWKRTGSMALLSGVSGYSGTMAGTAIQQALVKNSSRLAAKVAMSQFGALTIGQLSGSVITGAMFSYGAYVLGYSDLRTANRNMIATTGGAAVGALTSVTAMSLVSTFATASTGTAISTLSGAAATNATLAWFGGGAIAAGGGGTALGATILSGGTAIVVIAAGAGIMYLFQLDDEKTERERVAYLVQSIQEHLNQQSTQH